MKVHHTITPWLLGQAGDIGYSDAIAPCHIWTLKGAGHGLVATTCPRLKYIGKMDLKCCRCRPEFATHIDRVNFYCDPEEWWNSLNKEI